MCIGAFTGEITNYTSFISRFDGEEGEEGEDDDDEDDDDDAPPKGKGHAKGGAAKGGKAAEQPPECKQQ